MENIPATRSTGDWVREVSRAAASAIPVVGGPVQVVIEAVFRAPLEKRREVWFNELAVVVAEIHTRVGELTPEKLATNQAFVDAAIHATQAAMRTQHAVKLAALRNAVLNSGIGAAIEDDEQLMFIRLVDVFTASHLRLLSFLHEPEKWMEANGVVPFPLGGGGVEDAIAHALPGLGDREACEQLLRELQVEGLVQQGQILGLSMSKRSLMARRTKARGQRFLRFISPPV